MTEQTGKPGADDGFSVPLVWRGVEDLPVVFLNSFVVQWEPEEFILTLGQVTPPILLGPEEQRAAEAKKITEVRVKILGRFSMTRARAQELVRLLSEQLAKYDERLKDGRGAR